MTQQTDEKFIELSLKWNNLGAGYSIRPEILATHGQQTDVDPDATLVDSFTHIFNDLHMFGIILACIKRYPAGFIPGRILLIFTGRHYQNPPLIEDKDTMSGLLALFIISKTFKESDSRWLPVYDFTLFALNRNGFEKLATKEMLPWDSNGPMSTVIHMANMTNSFDKDLEKYGVCFPETSFAPDKKLGDRLKTLSENKYYRERLPK